MVNKQNNKKRLRENRYRKAARQTRTFGSGWLTALFKVLAAGAAIVAMSLVFIFGHDWLTQCNYFRAQTVKISGIERLDREQVLEAAEISKGTNIISINLRTARKRLLTLAWVAEAEIRREFPDSFMIRIREHKPVAVIELGKHFLVNAEGEIFKETDKKKFSELPVISGVEYQYWKADNSGNIPVFESVMFVVNRGEKQDTVLPTGKIRQIQVDRELGLTVETEEFPAQLIHLGYGGYESKYRRLSKIFSYLERRGASFELEEIDLRYPDRIVAKPAGDETHLTKRQKEA